MQDLDSSDVTLASVDATLLSCWEEKVKQGADCSLHLEHRKGVIITILKCSSKRKTLEAKSIPLLKILKLRINRRNKEAKISLNLSFHTNSGW